MKFIFEELKSSFIEGNKKTSSMPRYSVHLISLNTISLLWNSSFSDYLLASLPVTPFNAQNLC